MISRKTYFFADLHADKAAFMKSLSFCDDQSALYLIGGDCLDKGPSNLELLEEIENLSKRVEVKILVGNHDIRMLMVLLGWEKQKSPRLQQIFTPSRFKKRITPFLDECGGIEKAKQMFLAPAGKFSWFFSSLQLLHLDRDFLFVHAGVSDQFAKELCRDKADVLNKKFQDALADADKLYDFYYGPCGSSFRTKYRQEKDFPFTAAGAKDLSALGIEYVVHGHNSQIKGHQVEHHAGVKHIRCDCSVDAGTRKKIGLDKKAGYAVAVFDNTDTAIKCYSSEGYLEINK